MEQLWLQFYKHKQYNNNLPVASTNHPSACDYDPCWGSPQTNSVPNDSLLQLLSAPSTHKPGAHDHTQTGGQIVDKVHLVAARIIYYYVAKCAQYRSCKKNGKTHTRWSHVPHNDSPFGTCDVINPQWNMQPNFLVLIMLIQPLQYTLISNAGVSEFITLPCPHITYYEHSLVIKKCLTVNK